MMNRLVMLALLLSGCASEVCDPVGTYELAGTYKEGNCGLTDPFDYNLIVTELRSSYVFTVSNGGTVTPTVVGETYVPDQDNVDCRLDVSATYDNPGSLLTETIALNTRGQNVVGTGLLTIDFPDGTGCQQVFLLTGTIR